ncbi:MAG TPA: peptidoglycan-binding protein, partial [Candidatus Pullichristensenella stercorigallinarum]|nr:peptidoglycan-binding protein [Candidatus Pullichristensenella stercorigallinarum]
MKKLFATLLLLAIVFTAIPAVQSSAGAESNYYIHVDVTNQYVTVYRSSDNAIVRQMICSTGASGSSTPLGTFVMPNKRYSSERTEWYYTMGVYVKYPSRIVNGILFHSIPFSSRNDGTMQQSAYNKLGSPASHGCIRLRVDDSKWIADNCPPGTVVKIFKSGSRNDIVRSVLLNTGSYSIDTGLSYNQFIGLSDDPNTLDRASTGAEVKKLETILQGLGFFTGTPDGTYDTTTIQAVAAFQKAAGLEQTGLADLDTRTLAASANAPTGTRTTFKIGMSGRAVKKLQEALYALKLYDGPIDGTYSQAVAEAVRFLQTVEIQPVNGEADQALQEAALSLAASLLERFGNGEDYQLLTLKQDALMARVSNTAFLWMRSSPSTSATTINKLAEGTQLLVLAQQGDWTQVRLGAQTGYCMTSYLIIYNGETISLHYGQDFLPEGESLKRVQELMIELGYMDGTASGVYDLETIEAVKAFQQAIGEDPDGLPGEETLAQAEREDAPTGTRVALRQGDSGRPVEDLQAALAALKLYDGEIDGVYDAQVAQAVSLFEKYYGYTQNGVAESDVQKDIRSRAQVLLERFGHGDYNVIAIAEQSRVATVTADALWVRSAPYATASTIGKVEKGSVLSVLDDLDGWTKVAYGERDGYVMSQYVSITTETSYDLFYDKDLIAETDVKTLQQALISLGYLTGNASGTYDRATIEAVKAFETALGDKYADGMANRGVLEAALADDAPINTSITLSPNTNASRVVKSLQESLQALGYYTGAVDGNYSQSVAQAVKMYQRAHGLQLNGIANKALQEAVHANAQAVREEYGDEYVIILTEETVQTATVTADSLRLRAKPSASAETLTIMEKGTQLAVQSIQSGWVQVEYGDLDGYVMSQYVAVTSELLVKPQYGKDLLGGAEA